MKQYLHDEDFLKKVKTCLDFNMEQMETETLVRLRRIRHYAMSAGKRSFFVIPDRFYKPAVGLMAVACVIIMCVFLCFRSPEIPNINHMEDMEILSCGDNLGLYEQLDFYSWIAKESRHAG